MPVSIIRRLPAVLALAACMPVNTVPDPVKPTDPVQEFELEIPANLEVRHVDFSASSFSDVSGGQPVRGRAFLKVYAVDRASGDPVLLLYEDIARRKHPVQVIRMRAAVGR
jgi:hypothetical protein